MRFFLHFLILAALLTGQVALAIKKYPECYRMYFELRAATEESRAKLDRGEKAPPVTVSSYGSTMKNMHAAESEGTDYSDIAMWFDSIDAKKFRKSMLMTVQGKQEEGAAKKQAFLKKFLDDWPTKYRPRAVKVPENWGKWKAETRKEFKEQAALKQADWKRFMEEWPDKYIPEDVPVPKDWDKWSYERRIDYLAKGGGNPFDFINMEGKNRLFVNEALTYDELLNTKLTPPNMSVVNDWEGWEVKTKAGFSDRAQYEKWRDMAEDGLEGSVGHQHIIHGWPTDPLKRKKIAGPYIEMIDATAWFLYFRQLKRNPDEISSVVSHKYLNLYTEPMLQRLEDAYVAGKPEDFKERFRMIGAKNFPPLEGQDAGGMNAVPSIELRSGNKHVKRDEMKDVVEARLVSGDYSGLRTRDTIDKMRFQANVPTRAVASKWIKKEADLKALEDFEEIFEYPPLVAKFNPHPMAANHLHTKLIAPMLPWENRLNLNYKIDVLHRAQKRYAEEYVDIAKKYLRKYPKVKGETHKVSELRDEIMEEIEKLNYRFARRVRLDLDLGHYLAPKPKALPEITIKNSSGPVDVNDLGFGIEYSFRFSERPRSKSAAEKQIKAAATDLCKAFGCDPKTNLVRDEDGGHGHGLSVRYFVYDKEGQKWRVEWDGIKRDYDKNNLPINPRGGHIEVPTPKFAPKNMKEVLQLYRIMAELGNYPKRIAGGGHLNFDLKPILRFRPKVAGEKLRNIVAHFESNSPMIQFIWQHPSRLRVAAPAPAADFYDDFVKAINSFAGTPEQFAKILYDKKYFNTYVDRKPAYVQLNLTGMMHELAPKEWQKTIDIKKPGQEWFPSFAGKANDRAELRLNDAPTDPYMAALQYKYYRALLDKAINTEGKIELKPIFTQTDFEVWKKNPDIFMAAAEKHLREHGLDPEEFRPLLIQSWDVQNYNPKLQFNKTVYDRFLLEEEEEEVGRSMSRLDRRLRRGPEEEEEMPLFRLKRRLRNLKLEYGDTPTVDQKEYLKSLARRVTIKERKEAAIKEKWAALIRKGTWNTEKYFAYLSERRDLPVWQIELRYLHEQRKRYGDKIPKGYDPELYLRQKAKNDKDYINLLTRAQKEFEEEVKESQLSTKERQKKLKEAEE